MNATRTVGEITSHIGSGATPRGGQAVYQNSGIPFIRSQNVRDGWLDLAGVAYISPGVHAGMQRSAVQPLDVLLNITGASIGRSCVVPGDVNLANVSQHVCILRSNGEVLAGYLQAMLELPETQHRIGETAAGGSREGLNYQQVAALPIPWMDLKQQHAFVSLRNTLDKATYRVTRLLAAKRTLKSGLMRELLTGRRRFPEFADTGQWQELALGRLLEPVVRRVDWDDTATYRLASIRRRNGGLFAREEKRGADIKTKALFTLKSGDFVISRMQAVHGALTTVPTEFDAWQVSGMYLVLQPRQPERIRTDFLHYASYLEVMYRNVLMACHGVHIEKMTFDPKKYLKTTLLIPPSLVEQDRITEVFRTLDRELALLEAMLSSHERLKQVLMRRLLSGQLASQVSGATASEAVYA